ncbi:ATP-binding protein [bacterium]|nr:ATP-binding protein [bacterium]NUN45695.1 hypothetical protein [bacterium]
MHTFIQKFVWLPHDPGLPPLEFWRKRITIAVVAANCIMGTAALIPTIPFFMQSETPWIGLIFVVMMIGMYFAWFSQKLSQLKKSILVTVSFLIAGTLCFKPFGAAGAICTLFVAHILSSLLFRPRLFLISLSYIFIVFIVAGFYMDTGNTIGDDQFESRYTWNTWFIVISNVIAALLTIGWAIHIVINSLEHSLIMENSSRLALQEEINQHKRTQTERIKLEEEVFHMQRAQAMHQMAGGVAHDFSNILTSTLGYLALLQERVQHDPKAIEMISSMNAGARRGRQLIRQLLMYSRQTEVHQEAFQLSPLIDECYDMVKPALKHIRYQFISEVKNDTIFGDPTQMHQVLFNLMTNAIQAMDGKGHLSVKVIPGPHQYLRILVSDTGPGIATENIDKIFEPYFSTKPQGLGTGLGLAVVQSIIRNHHGAIRVRSTPGQGATFEIDLPLQKLNTDQPS